MTYLDIGSITASNADFTLLAKEYLEKREFPPSHRVYVIRNGPRYDLELTSILRQDDQGVMRSQGDPDMANVVAGAEFCIRPHQGLDTNVTYCLDNGSRYGNLPKSLATIVIDALRKVIHPKIDAAYRAVRGDGYGLQAEGINVSTNTHRLNLNLAREFYHIVKVETPENVRTVLEPTDYALAREPTSRNRNSLNPPKHIRDVMDAHIDLRGFRIMLYTDHLSPVIVPVEEADFIEDGQRYRFHMGDGHHFVEKRGAVIQEYLPPDSNHVYLVVGTDRLKGQNPQAVKRLWLDDLVDRLTGQGATADWISRQ